MVHLIGFTTEIPYTQFPLSRYFDKRTAFPSQSESALSRLLILFYYLPFQSKHVRIILNTASKTQAGRPVIVI